MKKAYFIFSLFLFISCKSIEARKPIRENTGHFLEQSIERNKNLNSREYAAINAIIEDSKFPFIRSNYGFWYAYVKTNTTSPYTPQFGDAVVYSYSIKTLSGSIVYPEEDNQTKTYFVDQENLLPGLREGLKLMKKDETVRFIFPSQMAYGYYGDNNKIGPNTPLIFDVTVQDIRINP